LEDYIKAKKKMTLDKFFKFYKNIMIIKYKVHNQNYKIILTKEIIQSILVDLKNLNSDKNILFVYDGNIEKEIILNIIKNLKTSGCSIFF
jgi:hypothetical protein